MRLLLVEDSKPLQEALARGLRRSGWAVDQAFDGVEGLKAALSTEYDVIVLDVMLPESDGFEVIERLRAAGRETHVLMLTAMDTVEDRVRGLRAGADDYLVKPFAFDELVARIEALGRRRHGQKNPSIAVGDLTIDTVRKTATRAGRPLALTPREYALIECLAFHRGRPVSRSELERALYEDRKQVASNAVDSAVCLLRQKLEFSDLPPLIHTRRGLGWVLDEPAAVPPEIT